MAANLVKTLTNGEVKILTTFFTGKITVPANSDNENWTVCPGGAFRVDQTTKARLEIISFFSSETAIGYVRVYDITSGALAERSLANSVVTGTTAQKTIYGPIFDVISGHVYEIQIRCDG